MDTNVKTKPIAVGLGFSVRSQFWEEVWAANGHG